jgi:hypothetical protein
MSRKKSARTVLQVSEYDPSSNPQEEASTQGGNNSGEEFGLPAAESGSEDTNPATQSKTQPTSKTKTSKNSKAALDIALAYKTANVKFSDGKSENRKCCNWCDP